MMRVLALVMNQAISTGLLSLAMGGTSLPSLAVTVEQVPNPQQENGGWVTDMANILSPPTESKINRQISELEAKNGSEIAVVTVPETAPAGTPKEFTTALFNHWGIGKADQDNGVLFLISKGDRRVEIETGYGVENVLANAQVSNIIEQKITPHFKKGNFDRGTLAGTEALVKVLGGQGGPAGKMQRAEEARGISPLVGYGLGIGIGGAALLGLFIWVRRSSERGRHYHTGGQNSQNEHYYHGSSGSSGSSGGFGGGSSGGGGAGGSW